MRCGRFGGEGSLVTVIELCVLTPDEWAIWRELRLAALMEAPDAFSARLADWQGDGDREERWRARLGIPGSYNLAAVFDGRPVGMVSGLPANADGLVELISMWVGPGARGQGVGDRLMRAVEGWARRSGAKGMRLAVMAGNEPAVALYHRHGYVGEPAPEGEYPLVKTFD